MTNYSINLESVKEEINKAYPSLNVEFSQDGEVLWVSNELTCYGSLSREGYATGLLSPHKLATRAVYISKLDGYEYSVDVVHGKPVRTTYCGNKITRSGAIESHIARF